MSDFREREDIARLDRMEEDEYGPARVWDDPDGRPDFARHLIERTAGTEKHPPADWREVKIAERECPFPGCSGDLDEEFFCSQCGNVSLPKHLDAVVEKRAAA